MTSKLLRSVISIAALLVLLIAGTAIASAQSTTLTQRLQQYVKNNNLNTKNKAIEQNIKLRCPIAQTSLKSLQTNVATVQTKRGAAYKNISDQLTTLQNRLNDQAFEITKVKNMVDTYNGKVTTYTNDLVSYKQALDDSVAVDCNADPFGFYGALLTARLYHDRMTPDVADIRDYALNTVKPNLDLVKQQLNDGQTTGGQQ